MDKLTVHNSCVHVIFADRITYVYDMSLNAQDADLIDLLRCVIVAS